MDEHEEARQLIEDLKTVMADYLKDVALPDVVTWPDDVIRDAIRYIESCPPPAKVHGQ